MKLNEVFEIHDTLNPKLWTTDNKLQPMVADKINKIVSEFQAILDIPLNIIDVELVGSNVSYNYTDHSDLDVHIIANFEYIDASKDVLQSLYNAARAAFNKNYDISIRGIDVELYVEDVRSTTISNGIYSVTLDEWVKEPKKLVDLPVLNIERLFEKWVNKLDSIVDNRNINDVKNALNSLYLIRKQSIDCDGEYGAGNQLFKELRNAGYIDYLKELIIELTSKELSLESLNRSQLLALDIE